MHTSKLETVQPALNSIINSWLVAKLVHLPTGFVYSHLFLR